MEQKIKAMETMYNGYRFRSRLEARWAVFFDVAGIEYQYEPEGFELSDGSCYLPDFYLPKVGGRAGNNGIYIEVKGEMTERDYNKASLFCGATTGERALPFAYERPIMCVGQIPKSAEECINFGNNDERFWNCELIDGDHYLVQFYREADGSISIWGWDNVDTSDGFYWFNDAFLAARQARFEHGEHGGLRRGCE